MNRHFKKYYFYFLGRLLDCFGLYDQSLDYYARAIRIRTFFLDVQSRYVEAFEQSSRQCSFVLHGGVGDFLQYLPFLLKYKSANYIVVSHFPAVGAFFKALGIKISRNYSYKLREEHHAIKKSLKEYGKLYPAPRQIFFDEFPFNHTRKNLFTRKKIAVIGLHITPSAMTSSPLSRFFIDQLIGSLINYPVKIILFGTKQELSIFKFKKNMPITLACDKDIIKNLALVKFCNVMIGVDSVFKTMSSMSKIPTICFYEDVKSRFRDRVFIEPYTNEKIMYGYKYKYNSLKGKEINRAIDFTIGILRHRLKLIS